MDSQEEMKEVKDLTRQLREDCQEYGYLLDFVLLSRASEEMLRDGSIPRSLHASWCRLRASQEKLEMHMDRIMRGYGKYA